MNVISYSLFGNHVTWGTRQFYWDFLPALVRAHHNIYPGWELRIHVDSTFRDPRSNFLCALNDAGLANVRYVEENLQVCRSMLWRMRPLWEAGIDYVLCRDIDSLITLRDRRATEMFIQSGASAHALNDHPQHTVVMMGGLCSFKSTQFLETTKWTCWEEMIALSGILERPSGGSDQILLAHEVWPRLYPNICAHRFNGISVDPNLRACYKNVDEIGLPDVPAGLLTPATDALVPFMGCPGYDWPAAVKHFDTFGDPILAEKIQKIEKQILGA